ncbi:MAG: hypothetical protein JRC60_00530 [Deltaproteobacteria bacterium]|nr:hypothetical protein [Deltaproteobacteria bacterium]
MKYQDTTIIEIAQKRGSAAKTKAGAWKYLLANLKRPNKTRNSHRFDWDNWRESRKTRTGDGRALILGYSLDDPNTPGRIRDAAWEMHLEWNRRACWETYRDGYGAICLRTREGSRHYDHNYWDAVDLLAQAVRQGKISRAYNDIGFDQKGRAEGDAIHHEIYDIRPKPFVVLVCVRETEGSKYGVRTICKNYYIIKRHGKGIKIAPANKAIAAKAAKQAGDELGVAIDILEGKIKLVTHHPCMDGVAYKQVAIFGDGRMASVYDDSDWVIGVERYDRAMRDHNGGLYVYPTPEQAKHAPFPDNSINADADKIILKCQVGGLYCRYGEKLAFSRCVPIECLA